MALFVGMRCDGSSDASSRYGPDSSSPTRLHTSPIRPAACWVARRKASSAHAAMVLGGNGHDEVHGA